VTGRRSTACVTRIATEALQTVELEGIFVQIGLLPNTDWLKGTIELSPRGEIIVDAVARPRSRASSLPVT
jgi:alkyl hydroperoxide reductase subunit AhpF